MPIVIAKPILFTSDNFESYSAGAFFPNSDWTLEKTGATYNIIDSGYAPIPSQHLRAVMDVETSSYISHNPTGTITDGTIQAEITMESGANNTNRQPGLLMRFQSNDDYVSFRLSTFDGGLSIKDRVGGVSTNTTTAYSWVSNTVYYLDATITGSSAVASVYSDASRTTLLVTVATTITTASGKAGIVAAGSAIHHFDNFKFTP